MLAESFAALCCLKGDEKRRGSVSRSHEMEGLRA
jgi:hypothetical protein